MFDLIFKIKQSTSFVQKRLIFLTLKNGCYLLTSLYILGCHQGHNGSKDRMNRKKKELRVRLETMVHFMPQGSIIPNQF